MELTGEVLATITTAIFGGGAIGTAATVLVNGVIARSKMKGEQQLEQSKQALAQTQQVAQQPINQLTGMVETLNATYQQLLTISEQRRDADQAALGGRIDKLELALTKCMDEHIEGAHKAGMLLGRLEEMKERLTINTQDTAAVKERVVEASTRASIAQDMAQQYLISTVPPSVSSSPADSSSPTEKH